MGPGTNDFKSFDFLLHKMETLLQSFVKITCKKADPELGTVPSIQQTSMGTVVITNSFPALISCV